jgi:MFS transporter, PAT family, beta-lactamase induction signal transducer AmpG
LSTAAGPRADTAAGWLSALAIYRQPRVLAMLFLGFSAGLPFYLVYSTLSAWLRQVGIQRSTIGMLAWVGILFSIKFLWAPVIDRVPPPLLQRLLGRRRGWMLLAQLGIAVGLFNISLCDPAAGVRPLALWALFTTFCAATQDIALDAWRIESAPLPLQGAMLGAYQIGYRVALIVGGAGALALAGESGWHTSYVTMTALVSVGVLTTLLVPEPASAAPPESVAREERVIEWLERRAHWPPRLRHAGEWFLTAVICPLTDFFGRYGAALALLILAFIAVYRLTEFAMGSMVNPFYIDRGFTLKQIATVVKLYGLLMSLVGVLLAGVAIARLGLLRSLLLGSLLIIGSNLGYALLAGAQTPTLLGLGAVNALDNLALAMHGTALLAFLSGLTSARYTATQYALFSSLYALPGKILEGTSGMVVDHIGYPHFFMYTASLALPGLLLLYVLRREGAFAPQAVAAAASATTGTRP